MKTTEFVCFSCGYKFEKPMESNSKPPIEVCPACRSTFIEQRIPITKQELRQYSHLTREIDLLSEKLAKLDPYSIEHEELFEILENSKLRATALLLKTEKFIYSIDDSHLRQVFRLKYVKGLTWEQVSAQLGGYASADCLRIMHDRYLKNGII